MDIRNVKDLAISGVLTKGDSNGDCPTNFGIIKLLLLEHFTNLERFVCVDAQHAPHATSKLVFEEGSPYTAAPQEYHPIRPVHVDFSQIAFGQLSFSNDDIWFGIKPFPWFEFGVLIEGPQSHVGSMTPIHP